MAEEVASFRIDFEAAAATRQVEEFGKITEAVFEETEAAAESSFGQAGQEMEGLARTFGTSGARIETVLQAIIDAQQQTATATSTAGEHIEAAIREVITTMEAMQKQTTETADSTSTLSKAFATIGTVLTAAGTAITATYGAVAVLVQTTTAAIVETDNYAQAVGISTEAMQAFQFAAQRVGGDTDALRESLRTSQDAMAQFVNDGSGPAAEALELFGLQLTDSAGKVRSMEHLLPELVTALANVQDPAERSRLAMQLFGEEDSRVMLALANNPKILAESASALEQYGLVMGDDLVQQSRAFQTGVTDAMAAVQGLAQELVSALLPTLNALLPQFTAWVVSLRESDTVQKELIPTLQAIIGYLGEVGIAVDVLRIGWAALNAAFNAAVMVILEGVGKIAQGLGTVMTAAGNAADVLGMEGVADKLRSAGTAVTEVGNAADAMGDIARESMNEWQQSLDKTIANLGKTTTATQQTTTATAGLGKAATAAGKEVTDATQAMAAETAKAQQQARDLREAYLDLGIKSAAALKKLADDAVTDFRTIQESGTETPKRLAAIWVEEVVPQIIDAYGTIPLALAQYDTMIRAGAEQTLSSLGKLLEDLGIQTKEQLRTTAAEAESNLLTIVSIYGVRSKEAAQAFEATIADIKGYHDELPPHIQRIADQIEGSHREAATQSAAAYKASVKEIAQSYEGGFTRINGIIQATGNVLKGTFQAFGTTAEEIRAQMAALEQQIQALQPDPGFNVMPDLAVTTFQTERLRDVIGELSERLRTLQNEEPATTSALGELNAAFQGLNLTQEALVRLQDPILGFWRQQQLEMRLAREEAAALRGELDQIGAPSGSRNGGTGGYGRTEYGTGGDGGTGAYGAAGPGTGEYGEAGGHQVTRGYEASARYRGSRYYSVVIGSQAPQLPLGVPLPSDLGMLEGGVSYRPHSSSLGSSMTQQTTINVNEPITIQTKADTSALTSEAVLQALNEATRRGVYRPELGSGLR